MEFSFDAFLNSKSGYAMPFSSHAYPEAKFLKDYGVQEDGSFNLGIDIETNLYHLLALADGRVEAINTENGGGLSLSIKYGEHYSVTYGGLSQALYMPGEEVSAGDVVALSGKILHIEVSYKKEIINPKDFLRMLLGNIKGAKLSSNLIKDENDDTSFTAPTKYDNDRNEILSLMMRFLPDMFKEIYRGKFKPSDRDIQTLENIFSLSALKNIFFENLPSLSNPFGLGERATPYVTKAMETLIEIFLGFLAVRYQIFPSTFNEESKKKFSSSHGTAT